MSMFVTKILLHLSLSPLVLLNGHLQGVPVLVVLGRDVRAPVQEELQDGGEPVLGGQVQRRCLVVVRHVHVCAVLCSTLNSILL